MATVNVKFRPSEVEGKEGTIFFRITHNRAWRQLPLIYNKVFPSEWDAKRGRVILAGDPQRLEYLHLINENIKTNVERLTRVIRKLDDRGVAYSAGDVIEEYRIVAENVSLTGFVAKQIERLKQSGRFSTAAHYRSTLNSVKRFLKSRDEVQDDVALDKIGVQWVADYEAWLLGTGVVRNTSSFYLRNLRALYNIAVDSDIIEQREPFRRAYTGIDKTVKRAIPIEAIAKIRALDLRSNPSMDFARDMFIMAFYLRGMSFVDMAFLRKKDLVEDMIVYRRRKTGQKLVIKWRPEMQAILDKYPENESEYLLPIITRRGVNEQNVYRNASYRVNRQLKRIGIMVGLAGNLTHYVARHSWASAAQTKNIPLKVISEGMGHDSEMTTRIYLASLDTSAVDRANDTIINSLQ